MGLLHKHPRNTDKELTPTSSRCQCLVCRPQMLSWQLEIPLSARDVKPYLICTVSLNKLKRASKHGNVSSAIITTLSQWSLKRSLKRRQSAIFLRQPLRRNSKLLSLHLVVKNSKTLKNLHNPSWPRTSQLYTALMSLEVCKGCVSNALNRPSLVR